ncbi:MAG TPA: FAD-dependent oxidoreductase, partial [Jatrophihabitans sp.]|nr:FAD-dependent oxidoreductase [Jatrophihabitans sp.]
MPTADVVVIGAGAIGTAVAWRCAQRGLSVTVVDPDPDRGAWHTAAGMLAPITELTYTETPLLHLGLESLGQWPAFAAELTAETDRSVGFRQCGTVLVAWDSADLAALRDLHGFATRLGIAGQLLTGRELRELEPALAPGLPGALHASGDHQVDPRLLHAALRAAGARLGVHT